MNSQRIYSIFLRQIFLIRNSPSRFVIIFLWVAIDVVLWGFLTRYFDQINGSSFSATSALFGAIILLGFFTRIQQGTMLAFFEDVWSNNFLNVFASPVKISEYLSGMIITSIFTTSMAFLFTIAFAGLVFGYNIFALGLTLLPFLLILFVFGVSLGIMASIIVLRVGPTGEWIGWPIVALISPLAGVLYPVTVLPLALQYFSRLLPASYVFESMRSVIISGASLGDLAWPLVIGTALSLAHLLLMYYLFIYNFKIVLRNGSLSRFSAESI